MKKCSFAIANILVTIATAVLEYKTAPTKKDGLKRIENRIKENKTVESAVDCVFDNSNCNC